MLLVTGITGHTGRYFLQELINNKYKETVRCVVRGNSDTTLLDKSGLDIEKVIGDLNDEEFINKSMVDVDEVMHIYNIHHSPSIVKAAINNNIKRAILVHTTGVYSNFKYASEEYKNIEKKVYELVNHDRCPTNITILRPTMIYGDLCDSNMSKFIKMVDKLKVMPVINGGRSLIQPVNARDLGKAFLTVLMSPENTSGKAYDLSGDKPIKLLEALKIISLQLNEKRSFISVPLGIGKLGAQIIKIVSFNKIDYIEKVERMDEDRSYSHESATTDFGYKPMTFEDGIKIEIDQFLRGKWKR